MIEVIINSKIMSLTPRDNNLPISKFESMLKTNSEIFFDSVDFEEIIHYYLDSGKNSLAKKAIKLGLKQHPNSVLLKLLKAEVLIFDGELKEADILLQELERIEPHNEEIYVQQATICSKLDNHEKAIELLGKALKFTSDEADVLAMIGMEHLYLDNFENARISFAKCLEVDFEDYSSLYNVVYCYDMEGKHAEAIQYLNDYVDKDPYSEVAWHQLGRQYFILNDFKNALKAFDYAVVIDDQFVGGYIEKAKTLEKLERYEEAIANFKETLVLDDPTAFVYMRIGYCYEKIGNTIEAIQNYKKAVHEDPLLDKAWSAITSILIRNRNFTKALYYVNKALEIDESNFMYWRNYAQINLNLGYYEEAIQGFKTCVSLEDYDLIVWIGMADAQNLIGDFRGAIATLTKARSFVSDAAEIEYRLSGLELKLGNLEKGARHLNLALTLDFEYHLVMAGIFPDEFKIGFVQDMIQRFGETS